MEKQFYVYVLASKRNGTLYIGVTSALVQRMWQHKTKAVGGFSAKYGVDQLVYFEAHGDAARMPGSASVHRCSLARSQ